MKWCGFVKNEGTILQTSRFIVNSFWTAHGGCIPVILLITPHHTDTPMPIPSPFVSSSVMFGCPLIGGFKINQISMTHCWSPCFGSNPIQLLNRMSIHSFSATPYHSVIYRRWICHCTPLYHEIIWHLHIFHVSPQTNLYYISIYSSGFTRLTHSFQYFSTTWKQPFPSRAVASSSSFNSGAPLPPWAALKGAPKAMGRARASSAWADRERRTIGLWRPWKMVWNAGKIMENSWKTWENDRTKMEHDRTMMKPYGKWWKMMDQMMETCGTYGNNYKDMSRKIWKISENIWKHGEHVEKSW